MTSAELTAVTSGNNIYKPRTNMWQEVHYNGNTRTSGAKYYNQSLPGGRTADLLLQRVRGSIYKCTRRVKVMIPKLITWQVSIQHKHRHFMWYWFRWARVRLTFITILNWVYQTFEIINLICCFAVVFSQLICFYWLQILK